MGRKSEALQGIDTVWNVEKWQSEGLLPLELFVVL